MQDDKKLIGLFLFLEKEQCFSATFLVAVKSVHVYDIGKGTHAVKGGTAFGHCGFEIAVQCQAYTAFKHLAVDLLFNAKNKQRCDAILRKLKPDSQWITTCLLDIIQNDNPASITLYDAVCKPLPRRFSAKAQELFEDVKIESQ